MTTFDDLVASYDAGRLGYGDEIYNNLVAFGLLQKHAILDIGCGTGLASAPLIENGYGVTGVDPSEPMLAVARERYPNARWVAGVAEKLPFDAASFDAVISAQALHHADARAAIGEIKRVLRRGGIVGIWWRNLTAEDAVRRVRDAVARDLGLPVLSSAWRGGFREFYAAGFAQTAVRVVPWSTITPLSRYIQYERSRKVVHDAYGADAERYVVRLEARLRETFGDGDPFVPLSYAQFLYLAKA